MRIVTFVVCILGIFAGALLAQGTRSPVDVSADDGLISEVRALRGEIRQLATVSIRTQLLIARLQLQEQRVSTLARQLVDAQQVLAGVRTTITGERARVHQLEEAASRTADQGRLAIQGAILEAGAQIEAQNRQELELRTRETELLNAVNDARARWTDFNDRLDALERSLPSDPSR